MSSPPVYAAHRRRRNQVLSDALSRLTSGDTDSDPTLAAVYTTAVGGPQVDKLIASASSMQGVGAARHGAGGSEFPTISGLDGTRGLGLSLGGGCFLFRE